MAGMNLAAARPQLIRGGILIGAVILRNRKK